MMKLPLLDFFERMAERQDVLSDIRPEDYDIFELEEKGLQVYY